jgi:hypothetical protein
VHQGDEVMSKRTEHRIGFIRYMNELATIEAALAAQEIIIQQFF